MRHTDIQPIINAVKAIEVKDLVHALKAHGGSYDFSGDAEPPAIQYETDFAGPRKGTVVDAEVRYNDKGVILLVDDMTDCDQYHISYDDVMAGELSLVTAALPEPDKTPR